MTRVPTFARTLRRTVTGRPAARARRAGVGSVTVTLSALALRSVRVTGLSLTFADPDDGGAAHGDPAVVGTGDGGADLAAVAFWRARAVTVAPDLTVPPAVVAFVGAWAVVARAGGGAGARRGRAAWA